MKFQDCIQVLNLLTPLNPQASLFIIKAECSSNTDDLLSAFSQTHKLSQHLTSMSSVTV